MKMGEMLLKVKISLLFLVVLVLLFSASLFTSSHAGQPSKAMDKLANEVEGSEMTGQEESWKETLASSSSSSSSSSTAAEEELAEAMVINERLLRANSKDYGRYDPAPALVRPPFKLIPN